MALASSSLPVPLSPRISTGMSLGAMRRIVSRMRSMAGEWPMMFSKPNFSSSRCRSSRMVRRWAVSSAARATTARSSSRSRGFSM